MQKFSFRILSALIGLCSFFPALSQTKTNTEILKRASLTQAEKERVLYQQLQNLARRKGWEMVRRDNKGNIAILVGVDSFGLPQYLTTENNIVAAATIGTSSLWPGGSTGLNLSGSTPALKDKMAIWDGGRIRATHVELTGRISQRDNPGSTEDHSTHVAGTLIASGVNPLAKGMAYGLQELVAYDFSNHLSEMFNESPSLLISNHSYGSLAGWNFNTTQNRWEFWGNFDANEDYKFGYYSNEAMIFDSIAYNAPNYLIVKSVGNNRDENGPAVGAAYWRFDANGQMSSAGNRPDGISSNDGYDIVATYGCSKNILTVGAVNPIPQGYTKPQDVVQSTFTSWGPTDDGRIKPDVVADGINLLSSIATSDNAYAVFSGTSMSSPNAAGSLLLLQEYYSQLHSGNFMRSATLKAIVIHTADEAGASPGPDYQNGWGLIDMKKAAAVITANNTTQIIQENNLDNAGGSSFSLPVIASGNGTISATIAWTDPKGTVEPVTTALNNPAIKLVNDLDVVIKKGATVYKPWILNPAAPSAPATKGDNIRDNVEKVELTDVVPGDTYTIEVTHKGTLQRGQQAYSLVVSGVGGNAYCASGASNTSGARIDSVSFSNIQNKNAAGCTSYSNFTSLTANMQPGQATPLFIHLNSCDATAVDKIVKVFMDSNNDGDFDDAGENIATSGVINGDGDFSTNITLPAALTAGKYALMRIVMEETNSAAAVTPCGTYTKGETQDYKVLVSPPTTDVGVTALISPHPADCGNASQYVTIRIRNFGSNFKKGIPITTVITQGATTVATLNFVYADTIYAFSEETYTYQTPFNAQPGTTYTFTSSTSLAGDQDATNNQNVTTVVFTANAANPTATAVICGNNAILNASPVSSDIYNWYNSATATNPIASGNPASTSVIATTYYVSKNEVSKKLGPANKLVYPQGSYNVFNDNLLRWVFTTTGPLRIENARLYIGQAGTINFTLRKVTNVNYLTGTYSYYPAYDQAFTVNAYPTGPNTPLPGDPNNDPADNGAIYYLGIDVPEAGEWGITIQSQGASIYRNNGIIATHYPYTIPGVITLEGNTAVNNTDANYFQQFYYFFYDASVELAGCPSGRVAVTPTTTTAPTITIAGNVLSSTASTSYQWYRDGAPIAGATSQTYTATQSGSYRVQATDAGGCALLSNQIDFVLTPVTNVDPSQIGLIVSPNPTTNGEFTVQLETNTRANLEISLSNTAGQKVYQYNVSNFIGRLTQPVKPGKLAAGVYYLQVQHDKKMYVKKILVTQ